MFVLLKSITQKIHFPAMTSYGSFIIPKFPEAY